MSFDTRARQITIAILLLSAAACSASAATASPPGGATTAPGSSPPAASLPTSLAVPTPAGSRPASPAIVAIVSPTENQVVTGSTVHIVLSLQNAQVVPATTTNLRPDQGHVHLYVDNVLVSMDYGLTQDLPVHPGTYLLKAEFVAADHAPFDPRVWSPEIVFTVK